MIRILAMLAALLWVAAVNAEEASLVGLWQHPDQPVIVEMHPVGDIMEGKIYSNSDMPDSVGKTIFRDLRFDQQEQCWQGRVYVKRLDEEKDTCLLLDGADQFSMTVKVGFFSKTVTWARVAAQQ